MAFGINGDYGKHSGFPLLQTEDKDYGTSAAGGGYMASKDNNGAIDFNERERYVDLSGVSAFCNSRVS